MICSIEGIVNHKTRQGDRAYVELEPIIGGPAYEIQVTPAVYEQVQAEERVRMPIHHHFSEAGQTLFGFPSRVERDLFRVLLSVSGVGASTAMKMLEMDMGKLVSAVIHQDTKALCKIKGIGAKGADRICFEAKAKLHEFAQAQGLVAEPGVDDDGPQLNEDLSLEIFGTLSALGYTQANIKEAIAHVATLGEDDITAALKAAIAFLSVAV